MKKLSYKLITKNPIIISDSVGGNNHISTFSYIPGSSILGITAARYLQENTMEDAHADADFKRLFLSDQVMFQNANLEIEGKRSIPVPRNIVRKKSDKIEYIDAFDGNTIDTKYKAGFTNGAIVEKPKKHIHFHTSRKNNRLAGKSVDGGIFTYEGLAENQIFVGEIFGAEADLNTIKTLFDAHSSIRLGRSKTAQYGECEISMSNIEDCSDLKNSAGSFVLALNSPTIILNKNGTSSTLLEDLEVCLGKGVTINKDKAIVRTSSVETYNRKWGSKRPAETAFAPGSVFEIKVENGDAASLVKSLTQKGLGIRRNEGFGEVSIVNIDPAKMKTKKPKAKYTKPDVNPPKEVAELFFNIIEKEGLIHAEQLGVIDKINPKMPNSLTSRLISLFRIDNPMDEIKSFLTSIQTPRDEGESVDKKAAEHLKRVKINGKSLFDILEDANVEAERLLGKIKKRSDFLKVFPDEVGISLDKTKIWIHYWKCLLTSHMKEKQS